MKLNNNNNKQGSKKTIEQKQKRCDMGITYEQMDKLINKLVIENEKSNEKNEKIIMTINAGVNALNALNERQIGALDKDGLNNKVNRMNENVNSVIKTFVEKIDDRFDKIDDKVENLEKVLSEKIDLTVKASNGDLTAKIAESKSSILMWNAVIILTSLGLVVATFAFAIIFNR